MSFKLSIGKLAVAGRDLFTNEAIAALPVRNPSVLDRDFLYYALQVVDLRAEVDKASKGPTLNKAKIKRIKVPIPPLDIQRHIVTLLDRADAARARQRRALARLDDLLAATFDERFGDPVTNSKGWPTAPFSKLFKDVSRGQPRLKTGDYLESGPVPVVDQGVAPVSGYADDPAMLADVPLPVIVFGDHTRRFKLVDHPFAVGAQGTKLLSPSGRLDPVFAFHQLQAHPLPSTGYARHYKFLKRKALIVPPPGEQEQFAEVVRRAQPLRQRLEAQGARLDALYQSLAASAFRGDLAPDLDAED